MAGEKEKVQFLPFHALNHFMLEDFRLKVIRAVLEGFSSLDSRLQKDLDRYTAKFVQVPGFRNSVKAPARIKVRPMASAFEKNADLVGAILTGWTFLNGELAQQVFDLLKNRGWELLPIDADRRKLPGFLTRWPKEDEFDALFSAYQEAYPNSQASQDEVSLMCVWLSGRLPVDLVEKSETKEAGSAGS